MKKSIAVIFILIVFRGTCFSQIVDSLSTSAIDRIKHNLAIATKDTTRVMLQAELCGNYKFDKPDSALYYGYKAVALAEKINFPQGEVKTMQNLVVTLNSMGNYTKGLQLVFEALKISDQYKLEGEKALLLLSLGDTYYLTSKYNKALYEWKESWELFDSLHNKSFSILIQSYISDAYLMTGRIDSSLYYNQLASKRAALLNLSWLSNIVFLHLGQLQEKMGNTDIALTYLRKSLAKATTAFWLFRSAYSIAQLYWHVQRIDSTIYYAKKSMDIAQKSGIFSNIIDASMLLAKIYDKSNAVQANEYNKMAMTYKDSLYNIGNNVAAQYFTAYDKQERQNEIETAKTAYKNQARLYSLLAGLGIFLIIAFILYHNNRQKRKANNILETTLHNLKSTQSQLIQSEKMASLGELTAGIAHEIQNPLNFVNNFSEVNTELIAEMKEEIKKGNYDEVKTIANDIEGNEAKINSHGRRAGDIVKGMLQHSRSSTGVKEPTDINALADEYLRLSYHGLRAKDKDFNATMKTDFDETIGKINIIPQDIGRVMLNLYNNAFYAVSERLRQAQPDIHYEPTVSVTTKKSVNHVIITVSDNGNGIPQKIVDKIFQPFFTTKPTGQGTGLGLSLSYDIVKAHGGEIKVETKEGEKSTFIIQLPIKTNS